MIAQALRARGDRACVRSRMRFGQTEASEQPALRQRLEEIVLLRVARIAVENIAHQGLYAGDGRGRAVAGGDFLQGQRERDVIQPRAAPLFRNGDAEQAHRRHFLQRLARKRAISIPARGIGGEAFGGESAHRVADHSLLLAEDHGKFQSRLNALKPVRSPSRWLRRRRCTGWRRRACRRSCAGRRSASPGCARRRRRSDGRGRRRRRGC